MLIPLSLSLVARVFWLNVSRTSDQAPAYAQNSPGNVSTHHSDSISTVIQAKVRRLTRSDKLRWRHAAGRSSSHAQAAAGATGPAAAGRR